MNEERIAQEWSSIKEQLQALHTQGAEKTFAILPGFKEAFIRNPHHVSLLCIDEGCTGEGIHLAGSGCGIPEEFLLEQAHAAQITEFTTHEGCGAWALAHPELTDPEDKEQAVIQWGKNIAGKLHVPHRHISAAEMQRPIELHNAFYALYDSVGNFNRDRVKEMGPGFVTSPAYFSSAKEDLELAVKIAFGPHGFGEKFDAENPYALVGIVSSTHNGLSEEHVVDDLKEVQAKFPEGLVKIDIVKITSPETIR